MNTKLAWFVLAIALAVPAAAQDAAPQAPAKKKGPGPCRQIEQACRQAGFVKGKANKGYGLWLDCIDPIMQGVTNVPGATKQLPSVDPAIVSECHAKRPKWGEGKVGWTPKAKPSANPAPASK